MYRHLRRTSGALLISIAIHIVFLVFIGFQIMDNKKQEDSEYLDVNWVKVPPPEFRKINEPLYLKRIKRNLNLERTVESRKKDSDAGITVVRQKARTVKQSPEPIKTNVQLSNNQQKSELIEGPTTVADVQSLGDYRISASRSFSSRDVGSGMGIPSVDQIRKESRGNKSSGIESLLNSTGTGELEGGIDELTELIKVPDNELGAIIVGEGPDVSGFIRIVRLRHSISDWWQDPSALPSLFTWMKEHTRIRADMKIKEGALRLTNEKIFEAPLIVMTGHDQKIVTSRNLAGGRQDKYVPNGVERYELQENFSDAEKVALRKYIIDHKGTLYFDDCGFDGTFAAKVKYELERIFPEYPLIDIPHDDELYNVYYRLSGPPTGGDVFWRSENNPHASPFKYHKGIKINGRWAVVYNRKDYMCAMETMEIPSRTRLRMRRSTDVHRFMTNLFVYVMKYGGNVDRTAYTAY